MSTGDGNQNQSKLERMRDALIRIMVWAEHDAISGESRSKAMADIAKACHEALEQEEKTMNKSNDVDAAPVQPIVMRELSPRYAFGILRNRFGVRPAQREPVIRWLNNLVEAGYPIADVVELCCRAEDWGQFYDSATWWLMRKDRNDSRKTHRVLIQPRSGLKEPTNHPLCDLGKFYA